VTYLEQLAKAILENRVSLVPNHHPHVEQPIEFRIIVDPDPEQEAIESIKKGKP
jgi:hypothetical protein